MKNCRRGGAPNVAATLVLAEALFSTKTLSPGSDWCPACEVPLIVRRERSEAKDTIDLVLPRAVLRRDFLGMIFLARFSWRADREVNGRRNG